MKAPILYRIAAVLLLLFAAGHTLGFRESDPTWGVDALLRFRPGERRRDEHDG